MPVELLIMLDALRRASARRITAVLPYYPYVRSDKKDQPRVPVTARLVADLLVTAGADRVVTVDLTADQIQGFFTIPVDHLTAQPVLAQYFRTVLSGSAVDRLSRVPLRELVVTDSVPVPGSKRWSSLTVLSVGPLPAEAVRRIHTGQSVSALFE